MIKRFGKILKNPKDTQVCKNSKRFRNIHTRLKYSERIWKFPKFSKIFHDIPNFQHTPNYLRNIVKKQLNENHSFLILM